VKRQPSYHGPDRLHWLVCGNGSYARKRKVFPATLEADTDSQAACVSPQQPKRIELPNGMWFFFRKTTNCDDRRHGSHSRRRAPRFQRTRRADDVYGEVWRTGGTKSKPGDQLDDYLEHAPAKVETAEARLDHRELVLSEGRF